MPERGNTKLLQVFSRQARQDPSSISFSRKAPSYRSRPRLRSQITMSIGGAPTFSGNPHHPLGVGMVSSVPPRSFRHCR